MPFRFLSSLKLRIVALAVSTGALAALGATTVALNVTQDELQRQVLDNDRLDRERTAALLGGKLETLKSSLTHLAAAAGPELTASREAMGAFLLANPVLDALFDGVFGIGPDGAMLARVERGQLLSELPNVADRDYFRRVMRTDQPVVSSPLRGKINAVPIVVVVVPVLQAGRPVGAIGGLLRLQSNSLFADPIVSAGNDVRDLVADRDGVLLWHSDAMRVLGRAENESGLSEVLKRWKDSGSPIDTNATSELSEGHLVSMAGIPMSDWVLVRLTPSSTALKPLTVARQTAWKAALAAGLLSALIAGVVAWAALKPIGRLRDRAERMLAGDDTRTEPWPSQDGEIGAMSSAFQLLLQMRDHQRGEAQALLRQLQAVLDNADVGLALTRNGRFEMVSRHFCVIFGCHAEDAIGQATRMIHPSDAAYEALSRRAHPAFMAQGQFDGEVELMRRDGSVFWARMRGRAVVPGDRTQGTIWVIADATQDKDQRDRLSWAASHDRLTGLVNRAAFEIVLEEATQRAETEPFCALFIDLDRFKEVNDTGGHAAGDALLRDIAHLLVEPLRNSDTVARLGGDEFAVLLPRCPLPQARSIAEKLRTRVEAYRLVWEGKEFGVGASIGITLANGRQADAAAVLRDADEACYLAKRNGRNQVAETHGPACAATTGLLGASTTGLADATPGVATQEKSARTRVI